MSDESRIDSNGRSIWKRALFMVLFAVICSRRSTANGCLSPLRNGRAAARPGHERVPGAYSGRWKRASGDTFSANSVQEVCR